MPVLIASTSCGSGTSAGGASSAGAQPQPQIYLPTAAVVIGPVAGATSAAVLTLPQGSAASWTAQTNTSWIHLTDTSGVTAALGSAIRFSYDANAGATRTGVVTFQSPGFSAALSVTQADVNFTPAVPPLSTLTTTPIANQALPPKGPSFVADMAGNIFYLDPTGNTLHEWVAASGNTVSFSLPVAADLTAQMAVDENQNIFFASIAGGPSQIYKWALGQPNATWVSSGLPSGFVAFGVTVDLHGNSYTYGNINYSSDIAVFTLAGTGQASKSPVLLFPGSYGFVPPGGLIADSAGKLDAFETTSEGIGIFQGDPLTGSITFLGGQGILPIAALSSNYRPTLANFGRDGSGNFYFGVYVTNFVGTDQDYLGLWAPEFNEVLIAEARVATGRTRTSSGVQATFSDGLGNIYVENLAGAIQKFAPVFVNTSDISVPATAGSGETPPALPTNAPINAVSSDPSWLTITGQSSGMITFSFTATTVARGAYIDIFGQGHNEIPESIHILQAAPTTSHSQSGTLKYWAR